MKVYFDTNVVVSAVATRGGADPLDIILAKHELVLGETVLTELQRVLSRKIGLSRETSVYHLMSGRQIAAHRDAEGQALRCAAPGRADTGKQSPRARWAQ